MCIDGERYATIRSRCAAAMADQMIEGNDDVVWSGLGSLANSPLGTKSKEIRPGSEILLDYEGAGGLGGCYRRTPGAMRSHVV